MRSSRASNSLPCCVAVGVLAFAGAVAGAAPTGASGDGGVLHRLAAASGCAAWAHVRTLRFAGTRSGGGFAGPATRVVDARSGAFVERWDAGLLRERDGYDGATAWTTDRSGAPHERNAPFARALARSEAWVDARGWCAAKRGGARVIADHAVADDGPVRELATVTIPNGATLQLGIDSAGALREVVEQQSEARVARRYDAIRIVAGVPVAFRVAEREVGDTEAVVTRWASVTPQSARPRSAYEAPPRPHDFIALRAPVRIPAHFEGLKIFVDAAIDGRGPFPLILDTGGHLILTPAAAARLGLAVHGEAFRLAQVREIRFGAAALRNQTVRIRTLHYPPSYRGPRPPVAGVIGIELFARYAVTIDPRARTVTLASRGVTAPPGAVLPLVFVEDAPLVRGAVNGRSGLIEIDTGNGSPTIVEPLFARRTGIATAFRDGPGYGGTTAAGAFESRLGRVALRIGAFALPDEPAQLVQEASGPEATLTTAANVGPSVLARFVATFEYARGTLTLAPLPHATTVPVVATGMVLARSGGLLRVTAVAPRSAAARAGVHAGTAIVRLAGRDGATLGTVDVAELAAAHAGRDLDLLGTYRGRRVAYALRIRELVPPRSAPGVVPNAALHARAGDPQRALNFVARRFRRSAGRCRRRG